MIRNLLYSLSLHLILILVIYLNFDNDVIDIDTLQKPIEVSVIALREEVKSEAKIIDLPNNNTSSKINKKQIEKNIVKKEIVSTKKIIKDKIKNDKSVKKKIIEKKIDKIAEIKQDINKTKVSEENIKEDEVSQVNEKSYGILSVRQKHNVELHIRRCYRKAIRESGLTSNIAMKIKVSIKISGIIDLSSISVLNEVEFKDFPQDLEIALKNAKRTLEFCSPLRNLPTDKYNIWRELEFEFNNNT